MLRNLNKSSVGRRILGVPTVGILASKIVTDTATGDSGPGLLYDEALANAGVQLRLRVTSMPSSGSLFVHEDGSFEFTGASDGQHVIAYNWYSDNVQAGSDSAIVSVGTVSNTVPGATLTGTSSLSAGSVVTDNTANVTVPGATLDGSSSISAGSAQGQQSTTAPGATLEGAGDIQPGSVSTSNTTDVNVSGDTLTGNGTIGPGQVHTQQNPTVSGATLTGTSTLNDGNAHTGDLTTIKVKVADQIASVATVYVKQGGSYAPAVVFMKHGGVYLSM